MTRQLFALSFGFAALIAATHIAQARGVCAPRDQVVERLASGYGETRQSVGLAANNSVLEVYASDESGTWTVTVTTPDGTTCLIASGQAYEEVEESLVPSGLKL